MTKKDFELIAAVIRDRMEIKDEIVVEGFKIGVKNVAMALATKLHQENNRFDTTRFLRACGVEK